MSIIGIAIGITTIVALGLITTGMEDSVQSSLNDVGAEITVSNSSSISTNTGMIDSEIVDEMKNRTGVIDAAGSLTVTEMNMDRLKSGSSDSRSSFATTVVGLAPDKLYMMGIKNIDGKVYENGSRDAIVGAEYAELNNVSLGDDITLQGKEFNVSGIFETGSPFVDSGIYVPLDTLQDITDKDAVFAVIEEIRPDVIVHCAAWTNVDGAEDPEKKAIVHKINVEGTKNMAEAAKAVDAKIVYLSTDYVFDGQGERPWQPDDKNYAPLNYYGQTKLEGELAVSETVNKYFIVRIAWVFGLNGKNFIKTMVNVGRTHDTVRVVNDQIGTPTYTFDLARLLVDMIETDKYGYYHATNEGGYISWYDFTKEIYRQAGMDTKVIPVTTEEYGLSVAARPFNSRLDKSKLKEAGFTPLPDWKDAVARYLKEADL